MIILDVLTAVFCLVVWLDIEWMDAKDDMPFIVLSLSLYEQSSIINGYLWNRVFNALAQSKNGTFKY